MTAKAIIYYPCKKLFWLMLLIAIGCKQLYTPPVLTINKNYLVVDGIVITGSDSTIIKLSRTTTINDTVAPAPETGAVVIVKGEGGDSHALTDEGNGRYISPGLNLSTNQKYQLAITTADGKTYESDFVEAKQSPPIDSLHWQQDRDYNLKIDASTHDPLNQARYYKWDYVETWIYSSKKQTFVDWLNGQVMVRPVDDQVYYCWSSENSSSINIYSTAKLADDVVVGAPVASVPNSSEKIGYTFSILVKQYALTKDAYTFWDELKTNTEQLGGLFDPQPGQVPTNIHCTSDPGAVVIGYASVSSLQTKRIFIRRDDLQYWDYLAYYDLYGHFCDERLIPRDSADFYLPPTGTRYYVLTGQQTGGSGLIIMSGECADCRDHGGTNIKPPFWP